MKRITFIISLFTGLLLFQAWLADGQSGMGLPVSGISPDKMIREQLFLYTDRTIYAVTENILFKADYAIENFSDARPWSTVVYVELIRQDGQPVVQSKFELSKSGTQGYIRIPEEVITGVYYLKAYTKWMCNFSAEGYAYKPVKIVNPFNDKMVSVDRTGDSPAGPDAHPVQPDSVFSCSADKARIGKRELVTLTLSAGKETDFLKGVAVSIGKKGSNAFLLECSGTEEALALTDEKQGYLPEPRGISISGKIVQKETGDEVPYARVHLAQLTANAFYTGYLTDKSGRFLFTFPYSEGSSDFYLEAEHLDMPLSVKTDPEFCGARYSPGNIPFELTETEKEIARDICINMQIGKFAEGTQKNSDLTDNQNDTIVNSFYGKPDKVFFMDKYVRLTTIREFFFELVPEFILETKNKKSVLKLAKNTSLVDFPVLCLIDNVPVTDMGKLLNIHMEKLERVEIITKAYTVGNLQYNGVIHAFSKNRDMAGVELSKNAKFFNLGLYSVSDSLNFPQMAECHSDRIPDRRNTLYWNPALTLQQGQEQKISFYTADLKGEYEILVQGLATNGKRTYWRKSCFTVE